MKLSLRTVLLVLSCIVLVTPGVAQNKRGPSTAEERTTAVKIARLLESEPFHKDAKKMREWFTLWLIQVPDISIDVCSGYLGPVLGSKKDYSSEIFSQTMFSSAAFLIEHPDQAKDKVPIALAGVEGALRIYEAILKEKPKAKLEFLDGLIAKRDKAELRAYVEEIAKTKCKEKL